MDMRVFDILKKCEGKKLELAFYEKESESWVLIFEGAESLLIDSVEVIADQDTFIKNILDAELPFAQSTMALLEIFKREKPKEEYNTDPAIEDQLQTILEIDGGPIDVILPQPVQSMESLIRAQEDNTTHTDGSDARLDKEVEDLQAKFEATKAANEPAST